MNPTLPRVGVHPIATDRSMPLGELGHEVEARGLHSIYLPEHTHVPVGSEELPNGYRLSEAYRRGVDPFIGCAYLAATTTLEVGTAISLVAQHDAIALAKTIATIDHLSGARMVLGVGFGSNRQEAANHRIGDRVLAVERTVRQLRSLWTEEEAEIHATGSVAWAWPKPVDGGPPILLGSRAGTRTFERIVDWANGWLPVGASVGDPAFASALIELRSRWSDAGRLGGPEICWLFYPGTAPEIRRQLGIAAQLGIQRVQLSIGDRRRDEALPLLDQLADVVAELSS